MLALQSMSKRNRHRYRKEEKTIKTTPNQVKKLLLAFESRERKICAPISTAKAFEEEENMTQGGDERKVTGGGRNIRKTSRNNKKKVRREE